MDKIKVIDLDIDPMFSADTGVWEVAWVESPAIEQELIYFSRQEFVYPEPGEQKDDFISRCVKYVLNEGLTQEQALGKCYGMWEGKQDFAGDDISFDWDGTLTTDRGIQMLENERRRGNIIHIISARSYPIEPMFDLMRTYDIPASHLHTVGSNPRKIELVKKLGIKRHYDNNPDVLNELGEVGYRFDYDISGLPPYESYPTGDTRNNMLVEPMLMSEDCGCNKNELYVKDMFCGLDGFCFSGDDEYSPEEMEALSILSELKKTSPMAFEAIVGQLAGATHAEVVARNHKKPTTYFKYSRLTSAPGADRDFCMSIEDKYFRRMEIDLLKDTNTEFGHNQQGYSKWLYKGGPNCIHGWTKYIFQQYDYAFMGPVEGLPGTPPKMMPNNGYYSPQTKAASERAYAISQSINERMSKQEIHHFKTDEEKRMVYMPLMIPNILIPRYDELTQERYWVRFTPESIERIRDKFHFELRLRDTNLEHTDKKFKDAIMVESWLVSGPTDKAYQLGFTQEQIPFGTWMSGYKVLDTEEGNEIWDKYIKTGKVRGASVEGNFLLKFSDQKNDEYLLEQIINILTQID
jgi:hypothetical protein